MLHEIQKSKEHKLLQRRYTMFPGVAGLENKNCTEDHTPLCIPSCHWSQQCITTASVRRGRKWAALRGLRALVRPWNPLQQLHAVRLTVMADKMLVNCFPLSFGKSAYLIVFSRRRETKPFKTAMYGNRFTHRHKSKCTQHSPVCSKKNTQEWAQ